MPLFPDTFGDVDGLPCRKHSIATPDEPTTHSRATPTNCDSSSLELSFQWNVVNIANSVRAEVFRRTGISPRPGRDRKLCEACRMFGEEEPSSRKEPAVCSAFERYSDKQKAHVENGGSKTAVIPRWKFVPSLVLRKYKCGTIRPRSGTRSLTHGARTSRSQMQMAPQPCIFATTSNVTSNVPFNAQPTSPPCF